MLVVVVGYFSDSIQFVFLSPDFEYASGLFDKVHGNEESKHDNIPTAVSDMHVSCPYESHSL